MRQPDFLGVEVTVRKANAEPVRERWKAWRVPVTEERKATEVATWLLYCPGAHAAWSYWWITLVHLRPIPGAPPAIVTVPGAGWEAISFAQDPGTPPDPDRPKDTFRHLTPIDWVAQFGHVKDDAQAIAVIEAGVALIMRGEVSPDSDFRSFWKRSLEATAACIASGKHAQS